MSTCTHVAVASLGWDQNMVSYPSWLHRAPLAHVLDEVRARKAVEHHPPIRTVSSGVINDLAAADEIPKCGGGTVLKLCLRKKIGI